MALDIHSAVQFNRTRATSIGWASRRAEIIEFLQRALVPVGPRQVPSDKDFAELVAVWQSGENRRAHRDILPVDGKLDPRSWDVLRPGLARAAADGTLKTLDCHIATLAAPRFDYTAALRFAEVFYAAIGIELRIRTEICPPPRTADTKRRPSARGTGSATGGEAEICERLGPAAPGVRIVFLGGTAATGAQAGRHGAARLVDGNRATIFTLSHAIGDVLLASPDMECEPRVLDDRHALSGPPRFQAPQIARIRANALLR